MVDLVGLVQLLPDRQYPTDCPSDQFLFSSWRGTGHRVQYPTPRQSSSSLTCGYAANDSPTKSPSQSIGEC